MKIIGNIVDLHLRKIYAGELNTEGGLIKEIRPVEGNSSVYIMPGLVDAHVHIESSMTTPSRFAEAIVPHGTLGVVSDPHEIANVLGIEGVNYMVNDSKNSPVCYVFGVPSCVPATAFETSGGTLGDVEVDMLLEREDLKFLSEVMNYPGVIYEDTQLLRKINSAIKRKKPVDGHAPGLGGADLLKYINAGITTDHECSSYDEAVEKIKYGMKILIREGSAARNLDALKELIKDYPDKVMLCSDDLHPEMLVKGHLNVIVSRLIREGYNIFDVLRACTVNPVEHYGLELGLLRTGDPADFIITGDPSEMKVLESYRKGRRIFGNNKLDFRPDEPEIINNFNCSAICEKDIEVKRGGDSFRVITVADGELLTGCELIQAANGEIVKQDPEADILKIIVKNRYDDSLPAVGFVKGFGLKTGAIASSVAHDSHNIICVGASDKDIVNAVNEVVMLRGGLAVAAGINIDSLKLDIAGILSGRPVSETAAAYEKLNRQTKILGSQLSAPFMTLSFMSLLVIPSLKLSDKGLFDGNSFGFVPLFS